MTAEDLARVNIVLQGLAEEFGTTPEELRQTLEQSYDNMIAEADPIKRFQYFVMFPNGRPSAEEIILQMAHEILSEEGEGSV